MICETRIWSVLNYGLCVCACLHHDFAEALPEELTVLMVSFHKDGKRYRKIVNQLNVCEAAAVFSTYMTWSVGSGYFLRFSLLVLALSFGISCFGFHYHLLPVILQIFSLCILLTFASYSFFSPDFSLFLAFCSTTVLRLLTMHSSGFLCFSRHSCLIFCPTGKQDFLFFFTKEMFIYFLKFLIYLPSACESAVASTLKSNMTGCYLNGAWRWKCNDMWLQLPTMKSFLFAWFECCRTPFGIFIEIFIVFCGRCRYFCCTELQLWDLNFNRISLF